VLGRRPLAPAHSTVAPEVVRVPLDLRAEEVDGDTRRLATGPAPVRAPRAVRCSTKARPDGARRAAHRVRAETPGSVRCPLGRLAQWTRRSSRGSTARPAPQLRWHARRMAPHVPPGKGPDGQLPLRARWRSCLCLRSMCHRDCAWAVTSSHCRRTSSSTGC